MALLGAPYRIMYQSAGARTGLTNVMAVVLKPDKTINGVFPLQELTGMFKGTYIYDYLTTVEDAEGSYFSRIVSPSENAADIVRFDLEKPAGAEMSQAARPVNIQGYLNTSQLVGFLQDSEDLLALVSEGLISGILERVP